MRTDPARVQLELASGQNEITAPFQHTAPRRRNKQFESDSPVVVNVPLATASARKPKRVADPEISRKNRGGRTPWVAFAIAIASVGFAVWWVMDQRLPGIDPRDVIVRNLNDARTAMADGRYSDPPERSAFHYYSTVLAIDPDNQDAIAGIDAIADRHLTNARVLLTQHRLAEASVAIEKARRVRPDHNGLAILDAQWRAALKRALTAAAAQAAKPNIEAIEAPPVTKSPDIIEAVARPVSRAAAKLEAPISTATVGEVSPETVLPASPLPKVADVTALTAALAADHASASSQTPVPSLPEDQPTPPAPPSEPKLIRMVEPRYPQDALMRGIEGWVDVSLQVSATGDVVDPRVEASSRGRIFNHAALAAVEQWKYEPRGDGSTGERVHVRLRFQRSN